MSSLGRFTNYAQMRSHANEVSFPGGKADAEDGQNPATTALRVGEQCRVCSLVTHQEFEEELGVRSSHVRVLGCLEQVPR
jgi:8-oxo-dGTP pyrophosphatase MutT (NUDIX family)